MKLEYDLTVEDIINFNMFHFKNSNSIRKKLLIQRIVIPLFYIVIGLFFSYLSDSLVYLIGFIVLALSWFIFYKNYAMHKMKQNVIKLLNEDKNKGMWKIRSKPATHSGMKLPGIPE